MPVYNIITRRRKVLKLSFNQIQQRNKINTIMNCEIVRAVNANNASLKLLEAVFHWRL